MVNNNNNKDGQQQQQQGWSTTTTTTRMVRSGETAGKWILIGSPHSHSDQAPRVGDVNMLLSIWGGNTIISNPMIFRPGMWPFPDQQWQLKCAAHSSSGRHSLLTRNRQHVAKARNNIEACSCWEDKWMCSWGIVCQPRNYLGPRNLGHKNLGHRDLRPRENWDLRTLGIGSISGAP